MYHKHIWTPLYLRCILPLYWKFHDTRAYRCLVALGKFISKWFQRLCPCLVSLYRCCVRMRRKRKKGKTIVFSSLSPRTFRDKWDEGTLSPGHSPRRMALDMRRRLQANEFSPREL